MEAVIRRIRTELAAHIRKRQFDRFSVYGPGTRFDATSGCRNASGIRENIRIGAGCLIRCQLTAAGGGRIRIGDRLYAGGGTHIGAVERIEIGSDVIIAGHTHIYDNDNHPTDPEERLRMSRSGGFFNELWGWERAAHSPVVIEDNVWIGECCAILKGVRIGKGAVVGCHSVVTHDIPAYTVAAGNPARVVKELPR